MLLLLFSRPVVGVRKSGVWPLAGAPFSLSQPQNGSKFTRSHDAIRGHFAPLPTPAVTRLMQRAGRISARGGGPWIPDQKRRDQGAGECQGGGGQHHGPESRDEGLVYGAFDP